MKRPIYADCRAFSSAPYSKYTQSLIFLGIFSPDNL
uniref:Uncharacterized protein n=1 Tax=Siphoviridae sp. ctTwu10 TaxID=2825525 RepID=A0A8S5P7I1_9CAUD|nr:MAG TPA: hypothetical protein [Siphoviridae sp. ctTwu10]